MTRIIALALAALSVSGCAVAKRTYGPDGREALSINCSGIALTWDACYKKAGDTCGRRGYDVIAANGENGAVVTANPQSVFGANTMNRTLLISCKDLK